MVHAPETTLWSRARREGITQIEYGSLSRPGAESLPGTNERGEFLQGWGHHQSRGDFDGQLHGLLQGIVSPLIDGLDGLDINVGDEQVVGQEVELVPHLLVLINTKHRSADDLHKALVKVIEKRLGDSTTDVGSDGNYLSQSPELGKSSAMLCELILKCQL